jgi:hypothetical protein
MKKINFLFVGLIFSILTILSFSVGYAQDTVINTDTVVQTVNLNDTVLNAGNVINQANDIVQATKGQSTTWIIMLICAVFGVIVRIFYSTYKGVKNTSNSSPMQFMFTYWVKDNALPKITTILTFIVGSGFTVKLPTGIVAYVILGLIAFVCGLFIDYIADILKTLNKKK